MLNQLFVRKEKTQAHITLKSPLTHPVMIHEGHVIRERFSTPHALESINHRVRVDVPRSFGRRSERRVANGARETADERGLVLFMVADKFGLGPEMYQAVRVVAHVSINHGWSAVVYFRFFGTQVLKMFVGLETVARLIKRCKLTGWLENGRVDVLMMFRRRVENCIADSAHEFGHT